MFPFGSFGDRPFAGDWDGDGVDGVGVFRFTDRVMRLTNNLGVSALVFRYPELGDIPVAGNWDARR